MSRYLDMVDGPEHVKKLTVPQLQELAGEIRTELIEGLAKGGGHLGPNLAWWSCPSRCTRFSPRPGTSSSGT